jgi:hypothetical protein
MGYGVRSIYLIFWSLLFFSLDFLFFIFYFLFFLWENDVMIYQKLIAGLDYNFDGTPRSHLQIRARDP